MKTGQNVVDDGRDGKRKEMSSAEGKANEKENQEARAETELQAGWRRRAAASKKAAELMTSS